jgi:hypothetical protein
VLGTAAAEHFPSGSSLPSAFVVVSERVAALSSETTTLAPSIPAPDSSITTPEIDPTLLLSYAAAHAAPIKNTTHLLRILLIALKRVYAKQLVSPHVDSTVLIGEQRAAALVGRCEGYLCVATAAPAIAAHGEFPNRRAVPDVH